MTELEAEVLRLAGSGGSSSIQEAHTVLTENKAEVFRLILGHPTADIVTLATLLRASVSLDNIGKTIATVQLPIASNQ